ncbi:2-oxoacid:ferredoxin oxidoreductase subunit beta [Pontiella sp.]|uniref:2-oxoacid:ferredoxin oxidoreductase subunit beta n=1 Tax=Pontiella sp. TaxID=2837462 RepID=UPI00356A748D
MSYKIPAFRHPNLPRNDLGYTTKDYEGAVSTLCAGCGHDSISNAIIEACFEMSIPPHRVAKLSGIGCSSKTPTYFLGNSHGFNSVHGRMPSVATGANMANRDLLYIGVSGDGDTASIGMGQFVHAVRRNVNMVYICENNGVYGLTKGQDSATTDIGSTSKKGEPNALEPIDLCAIALQLGATFVANSFSGDKKQLVPIIQAAIAHQGFAFINVISPCVTFNNVPGSTKAYDYIRQHMASTNTVDYVPPAEEITAEYDEGTDELVTMHDGSIINLHKLEMKHDIHSRTSALSMMQEYKGQGKVLTGILFMDEHSNDIHQTMHTTKTPLRELAEDKLCPGADALSVINDLHR